MKLWQLITLFCTFCCGILFVELLTPSLATITWFFFLSLVMLVWWRKKSETLFTPFLFIAALAVMCFAFGALRMEIASFAFGHSPLETDVGTEVSLEGIVVREPDLRERNQHLYVQINDDIILVTTDRYLEVDYGNKVVVTGELTLPEAFETDLGRIFNYPGYLQARGVEYLVSFAEVDIVDTKQANPIIHTLLQVKHVLMDGIELVIAEPSAALGEGLLLGVKQGLGDELETIFRKTGIIHIVVLSGYNVMLVVTFVMYILSFFLRPKLRLVFGLLAIIAFALVVGLSATVVRACIMAALLLIAQSISRSYEVLRALLFAGFIMLCLNPYLLMYDIGFQLSFMATLGLILALPFFASKDQPEVLSLNLKSYVVSTIATQIAVLPLLLYHIGEISLISVVVNVLVLPMVPIAMLLTFISGIVASISVTLALPIAFLTQLSLQYILLVASWFSTLPFVSVAVPQFSFWLVPLLYIALFGIYFKIRLRKNVETNLVSGWQIEEEKDVSDKRSLTSDSKEIPVAFR